MDVKIIIALIIAIPVILLPVAFVWYLNVSGIYIVVRELARKRARKHQLAMARIK